MTRLAQYRRDDIAGIVDAWNACYHDQPNFVHLSPVDLRWRVVDQPAFDPRGMLVARQGDRIAGFVHFGPRLDFWDEWARPPRDADEGHIYALSAPAGDRSLAMELLSAAERALVARRARRVLLGPSWVHGVQPFYNGIAGAYEIPGLGSTRDSLISAASDSGFEQIAEYGTPTLDLSAPSAMARLDAIAHEAQARAREWGIRLTSRPIKLQFFPKRVSVELVRGREVVATTAYGEWPEYNREYRRRLHGVTSVQVAPKWRGNGLGKLVMVEAIRAARNDGADGVHLHVWRSNAIAWNLYHRALGFTPTYTWITLAKTV